MNKSNPIPQLDIDIFDILSNSRRRHIIHIMTNTDVDSIRRLSRHVTARENEKEPSNVTGKERKAVHIALYQCHLPKLADAGLIEYNEDRGSLSLNEWAADLVPHMNAISRIAGDST